MKDWKRLSEEQRSPEAFKKIVVKTHLDVIDFVLGQWKCKGVDNLSWSILVLFSMILCWGVWEG